MLIPRSFPPRLRATQLGSIRTAAFAVTIWLGMMALAVPAPAALEHTETAELAPISATFRYQVETDEYGGEKTSGLNIEISRAGSVVYRAPISSPPACFDECVPAFTKPDVHTLLLEPGQEPSVVLDLFTGGAHCCFREQVFSGPGPNGTTIRERGFGDVRPRLEALGSGGENLFVAADDRFAYAFTDYADSGLPIQVLAFSAGGFQDVTRAFPSLIIADAARQWHYFRRDRGNNVGFFGAWAADEALLRRARVLKRVLGEQLRAGRLRSANGAESGSRFAHDLRTDLRRWGYT